MDSLTTPIGLAHAVAIEAETNWTMDADTTRLNILTTMLGMELHAQYEEMSDEIHAVCAVIGWGEGSLARAFSGLAGYVERAIRQAADAWQENAEEIEQGAGRARRIASEWHGGQGSALLSFSTCGAVIDGALAEEIRYELLNADVNVHGETAIDELTWLAEYVGMLAPRDSQTGWSELWEQ